MIILSYVIVQSNIKAIFRSSHLAFLTMEGSKCILQLLLVWSRFHYDGHRSEKHFQNLEYALEVAGFCCVFLSFPLLFFFSPFCFVYKSIKKGKCESSCKLHAIESVSAVKTTIKNPVNNPLNLSNKVRKTTDNRFSLSTLHDLYRIKSLMLKIRLSCFLTACV